VPRETRKASSYSERAKKRTVAKPFTSFLVLQNPDKPMRNAKRSMPQLVGNYEKCIVGIATTGKSDKIPALARATRSYESKSDKNLGHRLSLLNPGLPSRRSRKLRRNLIDIFLPLNNDRTRTGMSPDVCARYLQDSLSLSLSLFFFVARKPCISDLMRIPGGCLREQRRTLLSSTSLLAGYNKGGDWRSASKRGRRGERERERRFKNRARLGIRPDRPVNIAKLKAHNLWAV